MRSAAKKQWGSNDDFDKLHAIGQEHLLSQWSTLSAQQQKNLHRQIELLDTDLFLRQQTALLNEERVFENPSISPFQEYSLAGNLRDYERGVGLVKEGRAALLVLAGGQGSRLRCKGPKGCCALTPIKKKTLFQFLAEKVGAASKQAGRPLEMAVMTSPLNHEITQRFFSQNAFFGLDPSQVTFFSQGMWPLLTFSGNLFLEGADQIAQGPSGNGEVFHLLMESGVWEKWKKKGIEFVNVIPVDNPLAAPFDFELLGFHARERCDVTVKAAWRHQPEEKVGVLAKVGSKTAVIEYFELNDADKVAQGPKGELKYGIANLGLYCFSMNFIEGLKGQELPLHYAQKSVKEMDDRGDIHYPDKPNAWKFERFIFDVLPFAEKVLALIFARESCFAPLKNSKGEDSIESVHKALLAFDSKVFEEISGDIPPPGVVFELAPQFYYPTAELLKKWKGKPFPNKDYIHD